MLNNMVYCSYCRSSFDLPRWVDVDYMMRNGMHSTIRLKHKECGKYTVVSLSLSISVEQQVNREEDEEEDSDE